MTPADMIQAFYEGRSSHDISMQVDEPHCVIESTLRGFLVAMCEPLPQAKEDEE